MQKSDNNSAEEKNSMNRKQNIEFGFVAGLSAIAGVYTYPSGLNRTEFGPAAVTGDPFATGKSIKKGAPSIALGAALRKRLAARAL